MKLTMEVTDYHPGQHHDYGDVPPADDFLFTPPPLEAQQATDDPVPDIYAHPDMGEEIQPASTYNDEVPAVELGNGSGDEVNSKEEIGEVQESDGARGYVETYFEAYVAKRVSETNTDASERLQEYKSLFSHTAATLFEGSLREGEESNPFLNELGSILTSLDHNAGVYYSKDDIKGIFGAVARGIFDEVETKRQVEDGGQPLDSILDSRVETVTSLNHETSLPLVKDKSGAWRVADAREYEQGEDFTPLEVLRVDNVDKGGWNKYRFRAPTYTHTPNAEYSKQVADGWYTSEWYQDPNYWSAQVRDAIAHAAHEIGEQLVNTDTSVMFVTEGGVFKGASTAGTDLDTECRIVCSSPVSFEQAYQVVSQELAIRGKDVPFHLKGEGMSGIRSVFYDRSSGRCFYRDDAGEYRSFHAETIEGGVMTDPLGKHEKGVMVTTADHTVLYRKPKEFDNKEVIHIAISTDSGEVRRIANRPQPGQNTGTLDPEPPNDWL